MDVLKKIAFLGTGNMGYPMALNLHKKGFEVCVFDLNPEALARAKSDGLATATDAATATKSAEVVISMLPAAKHVESLYLGPDGLLSKIKAAQSSSALPKIIDCSTISPESAQKVAAEAKSLGFEFLDAPVSGGTGGAQAGTLTFMIGGEAKTLEPLRPIFEAMGKNVFHAGASGFGQVAKVCNNMLLAVHMIGTSESLALGTKFGMDPKVLSEIMSKSSGNNWSLQVYNPYPDVQETSAATRGYTGGFASGLMKKDLGLALEASKSQGVDTPLGKHALEIFSDHCEQGFEACDFSSVIKRFAKELK
jgi:3-hydroxyisobutyrate dehydrogenase